jgi:demethylmenaquinone methyltransferase/2-methoxy-6-polyprenyl-1,4-benzoquinol methylase
MSSAPLPPHPPLERFYGRGAAGADAPASTGASGDARRGFVTELFDRSARSYEWLESVMSFGSGLRYRRDALRRAGLTEGMRVLDVAVGTGLTAKAALSITGRGSSVVGLDASLGMLAHARRIGIPLVRAVAEELPIASRSFDFLSMGYALRHVADLNATFREYHRILRPGGRLVLLELTRPLGSPLRYGMLRFYMKRVVPFLARIGPGGHDARTLMQYYWETIDACVPPDVVLGSLRSAGFEDVRRELTWGVFSEYQARARAESSPIVLDNADQFGLSD